MSTPVFSVHPDTSLETLEAQLTTRRIGGAPVTVAGKMVGIVTKTDIVRHVGMHRVLSGVVVDYLRKTSALSEASRSAETRAPNEEERVARQALGGQLRGASVRDCMVTHVLTASASMPLDDVAALMVKNGVHRLPVIDDGELVGMLTSLDLIRHMTSRRNPHSRAGRWGHAWQHAVRYLGRWQRQPHDPGPARAGAFRREAPHTVRFPQVGRR